MQALQYDAEMAEQESQQTLQVTEERLIDLACKVQQFHEQIAQVRMHTYLLFIFTSIS